MEHLISLVVGTEVGERAAKRVRHAFASFCSVYGFKPVPQAANHSGPRLCYDCKAETPRDIIVEASYDPDRRGNSAPSSIRLPREVAPDNGEGFLFPCFHPGSNGAVDWLGEIFEWLSGAYESSVMASDSAGRIPYTSTLHGMHGLNPAWPYADIAMACLNRQIAERIGQEWPSKPSHPWGEGAPCVVAATHDIDFLHVSWKSTLKRAAKNIMIALYYRDFPLFAAAVLSLHRPLAGRVWLHNSLPRLMDAEKAKGFRSTFNLLVRQAHHRDANYHLDQPKVLDVCRQITQEGFELGLHGSYTSLEQQHGLKHEFDKLASAGFKALGSRQHWLRYRGQQLFESLREADARYDTTVGFAECAGFRNGTASPFVPYDFASEAPFPLLEIPLGIMDGALSQMLRDGQDYRTTCQTMLKAARQYGWGGYSVLWHDYVFSNTLLRPAIADYYWRLQETGDRWIPAAELARKVWPRYAHAGLLPEDGMAKGSWSLQNAEAMT